MKEGMDRYATEKRYKQKGYLRKYSKRSKDGETCKTSSSDSLQQSWEEPKEEIKKMGSSAEFIGTNPIKKFIKNLIRKTHEERPEEKSIEAS